MDTYFAPPERVSVEELEIEIEIVSKNPVMSGLLYSINGLIAILDEHRQIVALNDSFLKMLGIDDPSEALGLRHGEALQCIHADDEPAGCCTTKFCSSCGAAIAIVSSMEQNKPSEKICALSANRGDKITDMALLVKSHPINVDKRRFLLIFLQDITLQQQMAALERTFFHDVNNMLSMLLGASELLVAEDPSKLAKTIHQASLRLHREIAIQQCLIQSETCNYRPMRHEITPEKILAELKAFFVNHPVARKKSIEVREGYTDILINTDFSLLSRVLCNMTINALEATEVNGVVKIWIEHEDKNLIFCVWNAQEIPQETAIRIFQRNFSTKEQAGRGIGTFSMKLFGEVILGGQVSFTTSKNEGTIFRFSHPI
ncbi:hypothetical protein D3OALGB2SA_1673 [Olavius algarvensis associated proteobacterium Delta 3]|nr:hypothetical protein D3OALGB2SA_1673 [Olavius algarvensis associated proteobacterium Delta 3]